jgi:hypothetical protein
LPNDTFGADLDFPAKFGFHFYYSH